jgi:hypothetical protein
LAQYCIGKLYGEAQRQIWVVPSGQGKARITASAAALGLMSGAISKVHLVFQSKHLMRRDKEDFEAYWLLLGYDESQIEYHLGMDFKPQQGELIITDEADVIMFADPIQFNEVVNGCLVIGFTATPDNFNKDGAESEIIKLLKFQKYHYTLGQDNTKQPDLTFDEIVSCDSVSAKANFILKQAKLGPTLVFCKEPLAEALAATGCELLFVTEETSSKSLLNLDKALETGLYRVLVALNPIAMRGYDYRSPKCPMNLVVDQSFENLREAI